MKNYQNGWKKAILILPFRFLFRYLSKFKTSEDTPKMKATRSKTQLNINIIINNLNQNSHQK